jgi:DDE superfamily endonuclease
MVGFLDSRSGMELNRIVSMENPLASRSKVSILLTKNFPKSFLDTVYNCDETGLFFRLMPNQTLASTLMKGNKKDKEQVTVLLIANISGTHKFKPLVIGHSKQSA